MRVSTQQSYVSMTQSFNDLSSDLSHVVEQMATGKSILLPSDDPIAATRITQLNRQQSALDQYQSNIDSATAGMSQQESILDGVNNDLLAIRDDLLEAANGTNTADSLASTGQDIQSMTEAMVSALNYQDEDGHYVFGGTVNDRPPIVAVDNDGDGVTDSYTYGVTAIIARPRFPMAWKLIPTWRSVISSAITGRAEHPDVAVERATGSVG